MDENSLQAQLTSTLAGSPAVESANVKSYVETKRVPLDEAITSTPVDQTENPDAGAVVNTTKDTSGLVTQHINTGFPDSAMLVSSGGDAYIGGSVSPNSQVRARIIDPNESIDEDGFWLQSTDRFTPVATWTFENKTLKKPVGLETIDPDKAVWHVMVNHEGVPDMNFFGYEYAPIDIRQQGVIESFFSGVSENVADNVANDWNSFAGALPTEYGDKITNMSPEERAEYNRGGAWAVRRAQRYLDMVNDRLPVERSRAADIAYGAGSAALSVGTGVAGAVIGGIFGGPIGAVAGGAAGGVISSLLSLPETLRTRDDALEMGATIDEARAAQLMHLGTIGATEVITSALTGGTTKLAVNAAVRRGASKAAARVVGAAVGGVGGGALDSFTEVYQDKAGLIASGRAGAPILFNWTVDDFNTFYSSLILMPLGAAGGAAQGAHTYNSVEGRAKNYFARAALLRDALVAKAEADGYKVPQSVIDSLDAIAKEIYENPEAIMDNNIKEVMQGLFDKISNLDPDAVAKAQEIFNLGNADSISEQAFVKFDERVDTKLKEAKENGAEFTQEEEAVLRGIYRGMAYIGAYFYGQNPSEIKIPEISQVKTLGSGVTGEFVSGRDGGTVRVVKDMPKNFKSPYDKLVPADRRSRIPKADAISNIIHEFSHANDWAMTMAQVSNLTEAIEFNVQAIEEIFGPDAANKYKLLSEVMSPGSNKVDAMGRGDIYTDDRNLTEWKAQAIQRARQNWAKYMGLEGKTADYIKAVNALLKGMTDVAPASEAVSAYVKEMQEYVKKNSDYIAGFEKSVPASQMRAALSSYMNGQNVNWNGITNDTIADFLAAAKKELNSDALRYVDEALGSYELQDFVDKAARDFKDSAGISETTSERTAAVAEKRKIDMADWHDNEPTEESGIEDWEYPVQNISEEEDAAKNEIKESVKQARKGGAPQETEFHKKISRKLNGKTIEESMDSAIGAIKEHKFSKRGTFASMWRGLHSILNALGGDKLEHEFDLVSRYTDFENIISEKYQKLNKRLAALFGGSLRKYEDYVRKTSIPMYDVDYVNPSTKQVERRTVSKRELMSALLYNEQPDSTERIAMTVKHDEIMKYLDATDVAFAHALRDYLYDEYRKVKGKNGKVPEKYFPIMDAYSLEKGGDRIINDFARINTDEPVGLVDVLDVVGAYISRASGTQSGYFAALRRVNNLINYNARDMRASEMTIADRDMNEALDKKSTELRRLVRERLGAYGFEKMQAELADATTHSNEAYLLKNTFVNKIARNVTSGMLSGNMKQFSVGATNMFLYMGYEYNTLASYIAGLAKAMTNWRRTAELAKANETLYNRRKQYRYSEYMNKNLSANDDNMLTYLANYATRKDITSLENVTDFAIHATQWIKRVLAAPLIWGDYVGNALGYAASYDAAVKALGSEEAAKRSLTEFMVKRQSTSNQAVKNLTVRQANRTVLGNAFAFTGEPTQKFGMLGEDVNRMLTGDMSLGAGIKDIMGITLSMAAYVAVASGVLLGVIAPALGVDMDDDDWERIYDQFLYESVAQFAGLFGPYSSLIGQGVINTIVWGRDPNGVSVPLLSELANSTKDVRKGQYDNVLYKLMTATGIAIGAPKAAATIEGTREYFTETGKKQKKVSLWKMEGRSDAFAKRMSGVKTRRSRPKKKEIR